MKAAIFKGILVLVTLVLVQVGCASDPQDFGQRQTPAGEVLDIPEMVSIDVREVEGELHTVFRFSETMNNPPTSGRVNFPAGFFDGFADGGIKSGFQLVGTLSFNQQTGLPVQLVDNTHATINAFPPVNFEAQGNSLLLTTSSVGPVAPGSYALSFLPGVFNLNPGGYNLEMVATWPDSSTFTFHKLLLVSAALIPHLGMGSYGDSDVESTLILSNPGPSDITVTVRFLRPDGTFLFVNIDGLTANLFDLEVPAHEVQLVDVRPVGEDTIETGWARLRGTGPFQASVFFGTSSNSEGGTLRTAAGIAAAPPATLHVVPAAVVPFFGINTAFAIANPTSATAHVKLILQGPPLVEREIQMLSNTQMAAFVDSFFDVDVAEELVTSMTIYSDTDLAAMALVTLNGEQIASLPSGTTF